MHRAVTALALSVGLIAAGAAPAVADSTRAEYIAQMDPICQAFVRPHDKAVRVYSKNYKEWERRLSKGTLKGWVRQTKRTARSLMRLVQNETSLTEQIAAVPPLPADAGTVGTWLNHRRQADAFAASAARAFSRFKFKVFHRRVDQANKAWSSSVRTISGFGFQVCGVIV